MARLLAVLLALLPGVMTAQRQDVEYFEVRNSRLFLTIDKQDRVVSTSAIAAWPGWAKHIVFYTERAGNQERVRWYDAYSRNSQTVGTEDLHVVDIVSVRLSTGSYALLLALRDLQTNMPSVALATTSGVFHREVNATYGTAANDAVEIRRFDVEELQRTRGDVTLLRPAVTVNVSLIPPQLNPAGMYEGTFPAADASNRVVTLNLRPDGSATMVTVFSGKGDPIARRGKWSSNAAEVRVDFDGPAETLIWTVTSDGLVPKAWDRNLYGAAGLRLPRAEAPQGVPRRLPGTVR